MYNRYIPQPDGSYRRNRMPEPQRQPPPRSEHRPTPPEIPKQEHPEKPAIHNQPQPCPHRSNPRNLPPKKEAQGETSVTGFLRRLLPKDFDTGDLLIVLLLLLMAGDSCDEQNNALLTLALYFIM